MDELFEALRESCDARVWSRGVELARSATIALESEDADEVVLIVEAKARPGTRPSRPPRVRLFPGDEDWSCDCEGDDPCAHVAAAAIAFRQAARRDAPLPRREGGRAGHVGYRLVRTPQGLSFDRVVVQDGEETPLRVTLGALEAGRVGGPNVEATGADRKVERVIGGHVRGPLPRHTMTRVLDALIHCADLRLDDVPVQASSTRSVLHGRLEDHPEGFRLFIEQDPDIVEVFANGVVLLSDGILQAVGETPLTGREVEELRRGRVYPRSDVTQLATEIVPSLAARIPFEVRTRKLPSLGGRVPLRVVVETRRDGDALEALPLLFYGDPPIARVDAGKLVPLGDVVPVRDVDEERALARRLQAELGLELGRRVVRRGAEALSLSEALEAWHGEVSGEGTDSFFRAPPLVPRLKIAGDDFSLAFDAEISDGSGSKKTREAQPAAVMGAWRRGEGMVALEGGGLAPLPADWFARYGAQVSDLLAAREAAGGALPKVVLPDLARLCEALDAPPPPGFSKLRTLLSSSSDLPEATLPEDLKATLRTYQHEGVRWLAFLREAELGGLLADDMGLGKTLQTLCVVRGRSLVVAPASVVHNWADEIARFRPGLRASVYHGPGRSLDPGADVTLTTYAILRLDAEALSAVDWDTVVLDEAQAIKNPDSRVARVAFGLRGAFRVALTGTPVENRLDELWSQMHFTNPGLLGGRSDFESRYAKPIAEGEPGVAARLRARIRPFLLRRTKAVVAPELPERTDLVLRCTLSDDERRVYEAVEAAARDEVVSRLAAGGSVLEALEALLRLRQAACHPALVPGQTGETSAKVTLLMETLDEALSEGHKALVFSQWTSLLDLVEPHLEKAGVPFNRLDGSTRDRAGVVRAFQGDDGPPVMLVSLKAGGTGLNLTAADHVFLLDPWWNPAVEEQAASRAHRIGQTRPVMVHRLVAEQTVEERILGLQAHKRALFEAALGEAEAAARLTRADLLMLLE
jgi:superfamily II DNA or RNA helicase